MLGHNLKGIHDSIHFFLLRIAFLLCLLAVIVQNVNLILGEDGHLGLIAGPSHKLSITILRTFHTRARTSIRRMKAPDFQL